MTTRRGLFGWLAGAAALGAGVKAAPAARMLDYPIQGYHPLRVSRAHTLVDGPSGLAFLEGGIPVDTTLPLVGEVPSESLIYYNFAPPAQALFPVVTPLMRGISDG